MNFVALKDKSWKGLGVILGLVAYAGFIVSQSLNAPFAYGYGWPDSGVFLYMAKIICEGGTPYVDLFDHKGPVLYFINAIGYVINSHWGIWLVEWIFVFVSMYVAYRMMQKVQGGIAAFVAILVSFAYLMPNYTMGNYTEEYAVLFQIIALYYFAEYFGEKGALSRKGILLIGITFALVILMRPNLVFGWIPFCAYIFIDSLLKKKYKEVLDYIIYFLIGIAVVMIPVLLYLGIKGAIPQFIADYLTYNLEYSGRNEDLALFSSISFFANSQIVKLTFLLGAIELVYLFATKKNNHLTLYVVNYIAFVLGFVIVVMPGNQYNHYAMCLIPHMLLVFGAAFEFLVGLIKEKQYAIVAFLCFLYVGGQVLYPMWISHIDTTVAHATSFIGYNADLIEYIKFTTEEDDTILVTGEIDCWIHNFTERKAPTRYAYRPTPMTDKMQEEFFSDIRTNKPELIITADQSIDVLQVVGSDYEFEIQIGNRFLYRRK